MNDRASMDKNDTMSMSVRLNLRVPQKGTPMPRKSPVHRCPVTAFQRMISGKYKLRIIWDLKDGPQRYGEIRRGLLRGTDASQEIAPRVLSRELKALAETGMIDRKEFRVVPPKVEYRLTPMGRSFIPVIATIQKWGMRHLNGAGKMAAQPQPRSTRPAGRLADKRHDITEHMPRA